MKDTPRSVHTAGSVCAIILAAGLSSRMGGHPKALRELDGKTLLALAVSALHQSGITDVIVVTGHEAEAVATATKQLGARAVHNSAYREGMFSSIKAGLRAVPPDVTGVFLLPVDAALVRCQSLNALLHAWAALQAEQCDSSVIIPVFAGSCGHPPLIGAAHIPHILAAPEDGGMRAWLASLLEGGAAEAFLSGKAEGLAQPLFVEAAEPKECLSVTADGMPNVSWPLQNAGCSQDCPVFFLPLPDAGIVSDLDRPEDIHTAAAFRILSRSGRDPLPEEALAWLARARLSRRKKRHCLLVGLGALRIGLALQDAGKPTQLLLHLCGGILHDVAHIRRNHARLGRGMLNAFGWPECACVVGAHTVLPDVFLEAMGLELRDAPLASMGTANAPQRPSICLDRWPELPEAELLHASVAVYVADKFFRHDAKVTLEERFAVVRKRFAGDSRSLDAVHHRQAIAEAVCERVAQWCGAQPERLVVEERGHPLEQLLLEQLQGAYA